MADRSEAQSTSKEDRFHLATILAERVEILNVLLVACDASRTPAFAFKSDKIAMTTGVTKLGFGRNTNPDRLFISPTFAVTLSDENDTASEAPLSVTARFVLVYSVKSFDGIDNEHISAFAGTNGVFNAWPYWREFVQNTTARMGLPRPITIPVFRIGDNPFDDNLAEPDPSQTLGQAD
jgi:hypothetical protein